jgi:hypothetical protein
VRHFGGVPWLGLEWFGANVAAGRRFGIQERQHA